MNLFPSVPVPNVPMFIASIILRTKLFFLWVFKSEFSTKWILKMKSCCLSFNSSISSCNGKMYFFPIVILYIFFLREKRLLGAGHVNELNDGIRDRKNSVQLVFGTESLVRFGHLRSKTLEEYSVVNFVDSIVIVLLSFNTFTLHSFRVEISRNLSAHYWFFHV